MTSSMVRIYSSFNARMRFALSETSPQPLSKGEGSYIFAAIMKKRIGKIWRWFRFVLLVYVAGGVALYFFQDDILFHPEKLPPDHKFQFDIPFEEINYPVTGEKNLSIIHFTVPDSSCKGAVLYFHGNRKNVSRYAPFAKNFTRNGYEVWMMDYPGFGKSTGERNEQVLYDDAYRVYRLARNNFSADSIIIYGKSIGTGVAAQLASKRDCKRLILETPYYSVDALAKNYFFMYPVNPMTKYEIPIYRFFEKVTAPVSIFHGTKDRIIPYKQSKRLMKEAKSQTELITIKKGKHNNLNDFEIYHRKLDSLLRL